MSGGFCVDILQGFWGCEGKLIRCNTDNIAILAMEYSNFSSQNAGLDMANIWRSRSGPGFWSSEARQGVKIDVVDYSTDNTLCMD
jgi:hypothetical protein